MKKLIQNRLHVPGKSRGNCFPTVIACTMDLDSPEDVIQIQDHYESQDGWYHLLLDWLEEHGWELKDLEGHKNDDEYYLVTGTTKRSDVIYHVCIYKNGKLYHDPHPDQTGLVTEDAFEQLVKIKPNK